MGTFYTECRVENHIERQRSVDARVLVDTGSENTWISEETLRALGVAPEKQGVAFVMANGGLLTREVGFAIIRVGDRLTIDEVVFAQKGDLQILGARSLEGLNLMVDPAKKKLVSAGPLPAAALV